MNLRSVSKAVAGAIPSAALGVLSMPQLIPEGVEAPWWGHVVAGAVGAVIGFGVVYLAPANRSAD